jgi:hypothetical protein
MAPRALASATARAPLRRRSTAGQSSLLELLDDTPIKLGAGNWQDRNLRLYEVLRARRLIDAERVSPDAHRFLTLALIRGDNPAASDPQNAGHVRAQNENIIHYALSLEVPAATLSISLEAGYIHDLNKAVGEPLRSDRYAVRDERGEIVARMETLAQSVGLNHLGQRTTDALEDAVRQDLLSRETAAAIDRVIVHHGLGSSRFIRRLVDGNNAWWGSEFVDPTTGRRKLVHPAQPPSSLASLLHDLADSTQQMQAGVAWLDKYPTGFWRTSGRSYAEMLSGHFEAAGNQGIPLSLRQQIEVETETCRAMVSDARAEGLIRRGDGERLDLAIDAAAKGSRLWIEDRAEYLAHPRGQSVYHDVGRALGVSPVQAREQLAAATPSEEGAERSELERLIWASARELDVRRARELVRRILRAG